MDSKQTIIDTLNKNIPNIPSPFPLTKMGILETQNILSYEPEFNLAQEKKSNLNPDDQLAVLVFPKNLKPDAIAAFLIMVNAFVFATKPTKDAFRYFVVNKKFFNDFVKNFSSIPDLQKHPVIGPFYNTLNKAHKKIIAEELPDNISEMLLKALQPNSYEHNSAIFNSSSDLRNKINLMYYLCSDNIEDSELSPEELQYREIYKHFILQYIDMIKNAKSEKEVNAILDKFSHNLITDRSLFVSKVEQFDKAIGQLKNSTPLVLPIVLDDGSYANFFSLDTTQYYHVMCSLYVSKINQSVNFSKLVVNGDFICNKASAPVVLPEFINGDLDLSDYPFIDIITDIPNGVKRIDLSHSVKNFANLNKLKFPETVSEIMIARSVINSATRNANELQQIQIFVEKYPNIVIWDTQHKLSLREALEQQQKTLEQKKQPKKPVETVKPKKQEISEKTDDLLIRKEIIDILSKDERFANVGDMDRLIQLAVKNSKVKTEQKLFCGRTVFCVNIKNIEQIKNAALQIISENHERANNKKERKAQQNITKIEQPSEEKKSEQQKAVDIQKYIPRNIWKDICNSCKDSSQLLYSLLEKINLINTDYTKQHLSRAVQYIDKDGKMQVISSIEKKEGAALGQCFEHSDKRRIVWTINPNDRIIVATAFFETHAESIKISKSYKKARTLAAKGQNLDGVPVTRDLVIQNGYFNVSDLLQEYGPEGPEPDEQKLEPTTEKTDVKPVSEVQQETPVIVPSAEKPKIAPSDAKPVNIDDTTTNTAVQKPKHYTVRNLADLKAIEAKMKTEIEMTNKLMKEMAGEIDKNKNRPLEQLKIAKMLVALTRKKIALMGRQEKTLG